MSAATERELLAHAGSKAGGSTGQSCRMKQARWHNQLMNDAVHMMSQRTHHAAINTGCHSLYNLHKSLIHSHKHQLNYITATLQCHLH